MSDSIGFYRSRMVAFARSLPLCEAVEFLRGALEVSDCHPEMEDVRRAFCALCSGDDQLDLIVTEPKPKSEQKDGKQASKDGLDGDGKKFTGGDGK